MTAKAALNTERVDSAPLARSPSGPPRREILEDLGSAIGDNVA